MSHNDLLFIGIKGTVLALDRATGREMWRTALKGAAFVNLVIQNDDLYAAAEGELYCLDPAGGQIRWHNRLKGLGYGLISIAQSGDQQWAVARENLRQKEQAVIAGGGGA